MADAHAREVSELALSGRVSQAFPVAHPPEIVFRYFAGNEHLLKEFLGPDRVERLAEGTFRIKLNPHGALGLTLRPTVDVRFVEHPPDRVEMRSVGARLLESSHEDAGFAARFEGEARFEAAPEGTMVFCRAEMHVSLALPGVFSWMPAAPLEAIGNGVIHAALKGLALRLVPVMQRDIQRWNRPST